MPTRTGLAFSDQHSISRGSNDKIPVLDDAVGNR